MPDEGPQPADFVRSNGFLRRDLEVVEVPRKRGAARAPAQTDVEHPRGTAVEAFADGPDSPGSYDAQQAGPGRRERIGRC